MLINKYVYGVMHSFPLLFSKSLHILLTCLLSREQEVEMTSYLYEEAKKGAVTCPGVNSWKQNENQPEV